MVRRVARIFFSWLLVAGGDATYEEDEEGDVWDIVGGV